MSTVLSTYENQLDFYIEVLLPWLQGSLHLTINAY